MTTPDEGDQGAWRDERELPLSELVQAVATSPADGQSDDPTGNDAGQASAPDEADAATGSGDPDPTGAAGRSLRTDFTGRTGPN
jgi:hypothetical protein